MLYEIFGTVRQKIFDGKSWHSTLAFIINFFDTRSFLKHRWFPYKSFSLLWDNKFLNGKSWHTPIMHKYFSIPQIRETLKGSLTKVFGAKRQKILTENRDTPSFPPPPSPLLSIKFFDTRSFLEHRGFFGIVRQRIFNGKSWYPSP